MTHKKKKKQCITDGCTNPQQARGLCGTCRVSVHRRVKAGEFSDTQLVEAGILLPSQRKPSSMTKVLAKLKTSE